MHEEGGGARPHCAAPAVLPRCHHLAQPCSHTSHMWDADEYTASAGDEGMVTASRVFPGTRGVPSLSLPDTKRGSLALGNTPEIPTRQPPPALCSLHRQHPSCCNGGDSNVTEHVLCLPRSIARQHYEQICLLSPVVFFYSL